MKLDKAKKYDLSELTDDQLDKLCNEIGIVNSFIERGFLLYSEHFKHFIITMLPIGSDLKLTCATELFEDSITKQNMKELDKSKVYDLSDLTSEDRIKLLKQNGFKDFSYSDVIAYDYNIGWFFSRENVSTTNAKELFYTLENVQVDCRDLSEEQIKEMADVFENAGYKVRGLGLSKEVRFLLLEDGICFIGNSRDKHTITYEKFMELFTTVTKYDVTMIVEAPKEETFNPQQHYFNEPKQFRSLFELSHILELNDWEFDILKRLVRCRKKGQFAQDIQKIKDTADIYLNEFKD